MSRDPSVRCVRCGRASVVARQREDGRCGRCALPPRSRCDGSVHADRFGVLARVRVAACERPATTTLTRDGAVAYACPAHAAQWRRLGWREVRRG